MGEGAGYVRSWSSEKSSGSARGADRCRRPRTPRHVPTRTHLQRFQTYLLHLLSSLVLTRIEMRRCLISSADMPSSTSKLHVAACRISFGPQTQPGLQRHDTRRRPGTLGLRFQRRHGQFTRREMRFYGLSANLSSFKASRMDSIRVWAKI